MRPLTKVAHKLRVVSQLAARALWRRASGRDDCVPRDEDFRRELAESLRSAPAGTVEDYRFVHLPADRPPWLDTGIDVAAGDRVTVLAAGRVYLSRLLDVWIGPHFQLRGRIGERGPVFRGTRDTNTVRADHAGRLHLASYFPGEWADLTGRLRTAPVDYRKVSGGISALLIRWKRGVEPLWALRQLARGGDGGGLIQAEIARLTEPAPQLEDWRHLWYSGPAETFRPLESGPERGGTRRRIGCRTHRDVAIVQKDVSMALTPRTHLSWSWRVDALPSALAEDTIPTHDYLSIAVEFDNGQDITYYWSAELPPDTSFRCPLPTWADKETHVVIRSGTGGLGEWLREERNVYEDYRRAIGTPPPPRIARVWLIAVSLFQRREGRCEFANITLRNEAEVREV